MRKIVRITVAILETLSKQFTCFINYLGNWKYYNKKMIYSKVKDQQQNRHRININFNYIGIRVPKVCFLKRGKKLTNATRDAILSLHCDSESCTLITRYIIRFTNSIIAFNNVYHVAKFLFVWQTYNLSNLRYRRNC